jgi:hypothetical protein
MRSIAVCVLLLLAACGSSNGEPETPAIPPAASSDRPAEARLFWQQFQAAVAAADTARLLTLVRVPLEVRGQLDADPPQLLELPALQARLPAFLDLDSGLTETGQTMRELVRDTTPVQFASLAAAEARLGAFVFEWSNQHWLLARVYTED